MAFLTSAAKFAEGARLTTHYPVTTVPCISTFKQYHLDIHQGVLLPRPPRCNSQENANRPLLYIKSPMQRSECYHSYNNDLVMSNYEMNICM